MADANFCSSCGSRLQPAQAAAAPLETPLTWGAADAIDGSELTADGYAPYDPAAGYYAEPAAEPAAEPSSEQAAEDPYAPYGGYEAYVQYYYASLFAAGRDQWLAAGFTDEAYDTYAAHVAAAAAAAAGEASATLGTAPEAPVDTASWAETAPAAPAEPVFHDPLQRTSRAIVSFGFGGTFPDSPRMHAGLTLLTTLCSRCARCARCALHLAGNVVLVFPQRLAHFDSAVGAVVEREAAGAIAIRPIRELVRDDDAFVRSVQITRSSASAAHR